MAVHPSNPPAPKVPRRGSLAASDTGSSTAQAPQQLGLQLGLWGAAQAQVGPNSSQFCGLNATRWKHACLPLFPPISTAFWLWWGFVQSHVAHWACLRPNLRPNVPKLRHVGPQLGSSWSHWVRHKLCPSWAQVGSCSAQLKAKDGPSLTSVGFWLCQVGPLLSSLSYSLGAGGSRREATWIMVLLRSIKY